jgi:hypothetical protein
MDLQYVVVSKHCFKKRKTQVIVLCLEVEKYKGDYIVRDKITFLQRPGTCCLVRRHECWAEILNTLQLL